MNVGAFKTYSIRLIHGFILFLTIYNYFCKILFNRLYDVANVLVSIGIIRKLNGGNNMNNALKHRPSFRWVYKVSPEELLQLQDNSATATAHEFNSQEGTNGFSQVSV